METHASEKYSIAPDRHYLLALLGYTLKLFFWDRVPNIICGRNLAYLNTRQKYNISCRHQTQNPYEINLLYDKNRKQVKP